jgi:hypothetical protein
MMGWEVRVWLVEKERMEERKNGFTFGGGVAECGIFAK